MQWLLIMVLTAILRDEVYQDMELSKYIIMETDSSARVYSYLVQAFCGEVLDKKSTSNLARLLNSNYPLPGLSHLKRVKSGKGKLQVLIATVKEESNCDEELALLQQSLRENQDITGLGEIKIVMIPKWKPITRRQYEVASKSWPTNFHEDKKLESLLRHEIFSAKEIADLEVYMRIAITEAKKVHTETLCATGAAVVDPGTRMAVAQAHTDPSHPLKHAVMVCIDNVAKHQGGGAWKDDGLPSRLQPITTATAVSSDQPVAASIRSLPTESTGTSSECAEAQQTTMVKRSPHAEEKSSCSGSHSDVKDFNFCKEMLSESVGAESSEIDSANMPPVKRPKLSSQYLCTGYDVFTTKEPCIMCSMALLHSRVKRVFYGCLNPSVGGLGSQYKIHVQQGLNHHFEVYRGLLEEQCSSIA